MEVQVEIADSKRSSLAAVDAVKRVSGLESIEQSTCQFFM